MPALPPAQAIRGRSGERAIARTRACSRPPPPTTRTVRLTPALSHTARSAEPSRATLAAAMAEYSPTAPLARRARGPSRDARGGARRAARRARSGAGRGRGHAGPRLLHGGHRRRHRAEPAGAPGDRLLSRAREQRDPLGDVARHRRRRARHVRRRHRPVGGLARGDRRDRRSGCSPWRPSSPPDAVAGSAIDEVLARAECPPTDRPAAAAGSAS